MSQITLPYSNEEFERLARVISQKTGRVLIDPRLANSRIGPLVAACLQGEQSWIRLKLQRHHVRQPGILLGVYESQYELQAFAVEAKVETEGFIAISFAFLIAMSVYFNIVMSIPTLMVDCGNASSEIWPREKPSTGEVNIAPLDPERQIVCQFLSQMALRFLVAHELTHILHGHLRLKLTTETVSCMSETRFSVTEDKALESQTLEMDADSGAILECITDEFMILGAYDPSKIPYVPEGKKPLFIEPRYLRLWMFALYSLFRFLEDIRKDVPLKTSSHPRPMGRLFMIFLTLDAAFERDCLVQARIDLKDAFDKAIEDGEKAFALFGLKKMEQNSASPEAAFGQFESYVASLKRSWRDLRPLLEPLSTASGNLAAISAD